MAQNFIRSIRDSGTAKSRVGYKRTTRRLKQARDCLHIQAASRENTLSGVGVSGADGMMDTLTLCHTMAFPFGWGYIQVKTTPQPHTHTHSHSHSSTWTLAVILLVLFFNKKKLQFFYLFFFKLSPFQKQAVKLWQDPQISKRTRSSDDFRIGHIALT